MTKSFRGAGVRTGCAPIKTYEKKNAGKMNNGSRFRSKFDLSVMGATVPATAYR
ncbi:MAG TPA: hypothetical protein VG297_11970 [Bryobacteraceae bacterium]|nr:hypothetical protein [Bryobacteraceae bacterium]